MKNYLTRLGKKKVMENERALKIAQSLTPEDVDRIKKELEYVSDGIGKIRRELILKIYKALQDESI